MISYPDTAEQIRTSRIFNSKWYYSIELAPGLVAPGIYPADLPMLPRIMLRRCDLRGAACLDMGTMEGLIPTLMARGGASEVVAIDAVDHCLEKLNAVKHYYGVDFAYQSVGLMYSLSNRFAGKSFDLINCSGLLYHVFSPLMVLAGLRSLLKRNGLLIVSTNVILDPGHFMEFNDRCRMQIEANTFWYLSVPLFDYMVRYLKLAPIDCTFVPHTAVRSDVDYVFDKPSGYLSMVCRATDDVLAMPDDTWMAQAARKSWEYIGLAGPDRMQSAPVSQIAYKHDINPAFVRPDGRSIDPWNAVGAMPPTTIAGEQDTHLLRLGDMT
jgi:SAM-dependent methyltransferase